MDSWSTGASPWSTSGMPLTPREVLRVYQANWCVAWAFIRFDIVKIKAGHCCTHKRLYVLWKIVSWLYVSWQLQDARDGSNCNWLRLYINWHHCQINCNQLGLCIDEYIVELIAISLDCALMDVDSGFNSGCNGGFDGWFDGWFHLAVLGYQPKQSVNSSDKRLLQLSAKKV